MTESTAIPRSTYTSEERTQWISRYRSSGLSQVQFAQQHGLKLMTLRGWLHRQRQGRAASTVPQKTAAPEPKSPTTTFREIKAAALWPDPLSAGWAAEVTWPSGVSVRLRQGAEVSWMKALLGAVRQAC
jgi:transposase-like protein